MERQEKKVIKLPNVGQVIMAGPSLLDCGSGDS